MTPEVIVYHVIDPHGRDHCLCVDETEAKRVADALNAAGGRTETSCYTVKPIGGSMPQAIVSMRGWTETEKDDAITEISILFRELSEFAAAQSAWVSQ